jgi:hypothetical protein
MAAGRLAERVSDDAAWPRVVALAADLPGVEESTSYGTPALKVRGRLLARLLPDGERLALFADGLERDLLVAAEPAVFSVPPHYRSHEMVVLTIAAADDDTLAERLEESWRRRAPERLVRGLGGHR